MKIGIILTLLMNLFACQTTILPDNQEVIYNKTINETDYYTSKEDVSLYLKTYNELPHNYITKAEAIALGWDNAKGNLWEVSHQKSIGGDRFYNREGLLPHDDSIIYYECDIDYEGGYRNSLRLVYSNTGYIYYTADHYDSFELLYEGE